MFFVSKKAHVLNQSDKELMLYIMLLSRVGGVETGRRILRRDRVTNVLGFTVSNASDVPLIRNGIHFTDTL